MTKFLTTTRSLSMASKMSLKSGWLKEQTNSSNLSEQSTNLAYLQQKRSMICLNSSLFSSRIIEGHTLHDFLLHFFPLLVLLALLSFLYHYFIQPRYVRLRINLTVQIRLHATRVIIIKKYQSKVVFKVRGYDTSILFISIRSYGQVSTAVEHGVL